MDARTGPGTSAVDARAPILRPLWWLGVAAGIVVTSSVASNPLDDAATLVVRRLVELWIIGGIVASVGLTTSYRGLTRAVGPWRTGLLATVAGLIVVTQFANVLDSPYPFSQWNMYGRQVSAVPYVDIVHVDGATSEVPVAALTPTITPRPFMTGIGIRAARAMNGSTTDEAVLRATLQELANRGGLTAGTIQLRWCVVEDPTPSLPVKCTVALTVDLEGQSQQ